MMKYLRGSISNNEIGYYAYVDENNTLSIGEERGREGGILYRGPYIGEKTPHLTSLKKENIKLYKAIVDYFESRVETMELYEIEEKYKNGGYTCDMKIPNKVKDNHVFDEDLSVRRNREMAKEHNQMVTDMMAMRSKKQAELNMEFITDVIDYMVSSYNLNRNQAMTVERFVKQNFEEDYFECIDSVAHLVEECIDFYN